MPELTRGADKILVPVLPSDIDIHACSRCVQNLLLVAKVQRNDHRLGIIANRVRRNTLIYQSLSRFLDTLGIPIVATLRDSQNYVRAAEQGLGLAEMKPYQVARRPGGVAVVARLAGAAVPAQQRAGGRQRDSERRGGKWRGGEWRHGHGHGAGGTPRLRASGSFRPSGLRVLGEPVVAHLVRPILVVRPGIEIAGDRRVTRAGALHVLEPARVGFGAARGRQCARQRLFRGLDLGDSSLLMWCTPVAQEPRATRSRSTGTGSQPI